MHKCSLILTVILGLLTNIAICQIPEAPQNIQAPNTGTFDVVNDTKMASFSGSPAIDVDLCKLTDGKIAIPIGLSHDGRGVKPDVHPGWVGQNNNLKVGGSIVRTVKDGIDDCPFNDSRGPLGYFFTNSLLNNANWNTTQGIKTLADSPLADKEPDEFAFEAQDISGKFYLGSDGSWKVQSDQDIKVELISNASATFPPFTPPTFTGNIWEAFNDQKYLNHTAGFILTDEKGTKYEFGGGDNAFMEYSIDFFDQGKDTWVCNAWHLKSITTQEGQTITYTYERGEFVAQMYFSVNNRAYSVNGNGFLTQSCSGWSSTFTALGPYSGKLISPLYLKEVNTNNLKVAFETSISSELTYEEDIFTQQVQYVIDHPQAGKASKIDILTFLHDCIYPIYTSNSCTTPLADLLANLKWRKLDKIVVTDTYKNTIEKEFDFTYDNSATERLRLQKIQEIGNNSTDKINPHEFIYTSISGYSLPNYCKSHTDHWGFNNGKIINQTTDFNAFSSYGTDFRSPATNANYYLQGSLSKLKFPTGAIKEFTFEPNSFSKEVKLLRNNGVDTYTSNQLAGGLRLQKTKTTDPLTNNLPVETEFFYVNNFDPKNPPANLLSSGVLGGKSQYYWNDYKPTANNPSAYPNYTEEIFTTQSILPASENSMGVHVGYSEIVEKSSTGGWIVYKFSNFDNGNGAFLDEPFENHLQQVSTVYEPFNSKAYKRGKLIEIANYSVLGDPVSKINSSYSDIGSDHARSVKTNLKQICSTFEKIFEGTAYKISTNKYKLVTEQTTIFNKTTPTLSVISSTNYAYNAFGQVNEIKKSQSDGSEIIARTKYVPEYVDITGVNCRANLQTCLNACGSNGLCQGQCYATYNACLVPIDAVSLTLLDMKDRHIWWPIETINYRKRNGTEQIIGGNITIPANLGGQPMPNKVHKLHLNAPIPAISVAFSQINLSRQFTFNSLYNQPEITFNSYNFDGNPTQVTGRNGLITSYVWGYRNRLPIAEIKNETYVTISSALDSDENLLLNQVVSEADIRTKINALRSNKARKITTYTYDVVFGIKSITNPANIDTYFNYDGLGNLKTTKDHYGKILSDIVYQYANQPAQTSLGATPTNTLNYIATRTPRTEQDNISSNIDETTTTIGYVDGIGRPVQSLIWKGSPDKTKDIIANSVLFDGAGRNHKTILPTRSNGILGEYKIDAETLAETFYRDTVARNETIFEASPLSRPTQQFGAGQAWRVGTPKPQKFFYETTGTMSIPLYTADANGIIKGNVNYPANQLFMTKIQNEKGNEMIEIKDTDGKTIQKRMVNDGGELLITHFVYNDLNQLKGVIQPNAYPLSGDLSKTQDNLFFYKYDIRGRIIEIKVPASDLEYFVYDQWDRLVLSQTPMQKTANKWSFYKYDVLNREILRGEKVYNSTDTQANLQTLAEANNNRFETKNTVAPIYYGFNLSFPVLNYVQNDDNSPKIYQVSYFDDYADWASGLDFETGQTPHSQITLNGSMTGIKVLAKPKLNNNNWLRMANYYDFKNRLIQSRKEHLLATEANVCSYEYNFAGELLLKKTIHKKSGKPDLNELVVNTLDHIGRLKYIDHTLGNISKRIAVNEHDDIGRMTTKNLGTPANFTGSNASQSAAIGNWNEVNTWANFQIPTAQSLVEISHEVLLPLNENATAGDIILTSPTILTVLGNLVLSGSNYSTNTGQNPLQKVDYQHHIRGGLIGINLNGKQETIINTVENDFFSYKLDYDFDYNIKKQSWKHEGSAVLRSYDFTYDQAHRLQSATLSPSSQDISITNLDYDKNGNITKLQRDGKIGAGFGPVDNLTYDYTGNKLTHMQEGIGGNHEVDFVPRGSQNYTYYNDGSMKSDDNEGISNIEYDTFLRQPTTITITGGRQIDYIYSGSGELLQTDYSGTITEKWNNVENLTYKSDEYYSLNTAEGRVNYVSNNWEHEYFITDHLGNVRVSFKDNGSGVALKTAVTDRDPLGVLLKSTLIVNSFQNRNEFQSKTSELTYGLNRIDYGDRTMNPTIGRLDKIDRLSEVYQNYSNYVSLGNNPLGNIEIAGLAWKATFDNNGNPTGYEWIPENESYNKDGKLKDGLYAQAIFFSHSGNFDNSSRFNMGTSSAYVYKADGTKETFDATTYPSDTDSYPTLPEGNYEANVGLHKSSYTALRMHDKGSTNSQIELGFSNPAFDDGRTTASGINIHKPGLNNLTGMTKSGSPCSAGCVLVDRNNWADFITIFSNENQKSNTISVSISRSYNEPSDKNTRINYPSSVMPKDALRIEFQTYQIKLK